MDFVHWYILKPGLLKVDRLANLGQISHFSPPVKIKGGMVRGAKFLAHEFQILAYQFLIYFWFGITM